MKIIALLFCIGNIGMALLTGFMAMFSPMAMDAPGSEKSTLLWAFVYLMMTSPIAFVVTDIFAWVQFGKGNYGAAIRWTWLGFLPMTLAFLALFFNGK